MRAWYDAERGRLDPFMLVLEGSVPNEQHQRRRPLGRLRRRPGDGPADHDLLVDRSAGSEGGRGDGDRHVRRLRRGAGDEEQPDRRHGPARLPRRGAGRRGWGSRSSNLPGCPVQPDNATETLLALILQLGGLAAMIDLDDQGRPRWLFDRTVHETLQPGRLRRAGPVRRHARRDCAWSSSGARARWSSATCPCADGSAGSAAAQRGRRLHRLHERGLPGSLHALHGERSPRRADRARRALHLRPLLRYSATGACAPSTRSSRSGGGRPPNCRPAMNGAGDGRARPRDLPLPVLHGAP